MLGKKYLIALGLSGIIVFAGCGTSEEGSGESTEEELSHENDLSTGEEFSEILSSVNWQGTTVYDAENNDLTVENSNFIGLAKYDSETGRYEFFDKETGESREDEGVFFITNDGQKRILISETMDYEAVVEITELNDELFTYKRLGQDTDGNEIEIFVEHIPYDDKNLEFTNENKSFVDETGEIVKNDTGTHILGETLWTGTLILDSDGNDVTEYNQNFISVAKYDENTNRYEFFDPDSGESRGDFGYFDVINSNKLRAHASIGENNYGAVLEITELNNEKFTYTRAGVDSTGDEIQIYVEHEPYTGDLTPSFSSES